MDTHSLIIICAVFFLLTFISGALLSNLKKARNVLVLSLHKIIALLTLISTGIIIFNLTGGKW